MRTLKHKIADPLFAVPISIKVGAMQVDHPLDAPHLLEGERRKQKAAWCRTTGQSTASEKCGLCLRTASEQVQGCVKQGTLDAGLFQQARSLIFAPLVEEEVQS